MLYWTYPCLPAAFILWYSRAGPGEDPVIHPMRERALLLFRLVRRSLTPVPSKHPCFPHDSSDDSTLYVPQKQRHAGKHRQIRLDDTEDSQHSARIM
ncbi:hypothetical protein BDV36DRAFT_17722 [Aspergillus pseudocaelatus]|uniref:Secreted protein n=1 Tax=Aspergillus pseudocaelatus TaxID=1825620 RepID=A0ABQ6WXU0_9EURO|nr:hypothetical protein BDV36DRAFT_17722 [Aspergillus pseudocaelatus]